MDDIADFYLQEASQSTLLPTRKFLPIARRLISTSHSVEGDGLLRALLKRDEVDEPVQRPTLVPKPKRKMRTKAFPILWLYPEAEPEPQAQAEAMLDEIREYVDGAAGQYVPAKHLEKFYGELCQERGWEPKHWCVIGRELGKLTEKVCKKRGSKRFMAYKIPRGCA